MLAMCFLLVFPMTVCGKEYTISNIPDNSETSLNTTNLEKIKNVNNSEETERENEMIQDDIEFGLTINDIYYPIPIALKQLDNDGWVISNQTPYFLSQLVS